RQLRDGTRPGLPSVRRTTGMTTRPRADAPEGARTRVLIADDQALFREGLRTLLSTRDDIEVAGEAGTGDEAVALAETLQPDVVLMDLRMPGSDGIQATARIRG